MADDAHHPAMTGFDEKIVLRLAVSSHLAERHIEALGTDAGRFRQDLEQVALTQGKTVEPGDAAYCRTSLRALAASSMRQALSPGFGALQDLKVAGEGRHRRAGRRNIGNDLKAAQEFGAVIRFGKAGVAIGGRKGDLHHVAGRVQHAKAVLMAQFGGNLGAEFSIGQPQIDEGEIRLMAMTESDRFGDGARDAAHVVAMRDH
ncbi:MAG: hypothetical protein WDN69_00085 [Aliidongia sp.]